MTKYAKLYRTLIRAGLCVALVCNVQIALAAYAQLAPPAGWSQTTTGAMYASPFQTLLNKPSTASSPSMFQTLLNKPATGGAAARTEMGVLLSQPARLSSASGTVKVALAVDKQLASRMIAARVGAALLLGPAGMIMTGLTVYQFLQDPAVAEWWANTGYAWDSTNKEWRYQENTSCFVTDSANPCASSAEAACRYQAAKMGSTFVRVYTSDGNLMCQLGSGFLISISERPGQTVDRKADFETQVRPILEGKEIPDKLPNIVWPNSWPVKPPVVNPDSDLKPSPFFLPTGDPVPNPKFDPSKPTSKDNQPWIRPGIQVTPSPTPGEPWRVDVQPIDVPQPTSNPDDTPDPNKDPDAKPEPKNDADLCEKYPDILVCAKPELDTPDGEIPKAEREVVLEDKDLFGGGSCPADVYATVGGQYLKVWNWQQSCDYIVRFLKPVILVLGAFSALMIVSGGTKE